MCINRRVFAGNNLYSKGACYGILEKICPSDVGRDYIYLGKDKLKANVGMDVLKRGQNAYLVLLNAGVNWYEVGTCVEFILPKENKLEFRISSLTGNVVYNETMILEEMPERKPGTTRVRLEMKMVSDNTIFAEVTDLGFGEFYPATGKRWEKEIVLEFKE